MIPLPVIGAVDLFSTTWPAFDRETTRVRGRGEDVDGAPYTVTGSIQYADRKTMQRLPEGYESTGTLVIRTQQNLFYIDNSQNGNEGTQTFIDAYGERWRVTMEANWNLHGDYRMYIAQKYVDRG